MWKKIVGVTVLAATYVTCLLTFIVAYIHPSKSTLVTINSYNEANIELILLLATLPIVFSYIVKEIKIYPVKS